MVYFLMLYPSTRTMHCLPSGERSPRCGCVHLPWEHPTLQLAATLWDMLLNLCPLLPGDQGLQCGEGTDGHSDPVTPLWGLCSGRDDAGCE